MNNKLPLMYCIIGLLLVYSVMALKVISPYPIEGQGGSTSNTSVNLSGYVPYVGATQDLDLGVNQLHTISIRDTSDLLSINTDVRSLWTSSDWGSVNWDSGYLNDAEYSTSIDWFNHILYGDWTINGITGGDTLQNVTDRGAETTNPITVIHPGDGGYLTDGSIIWKGLNGNVMGMLTDPTGLDGGAYPYGMFVLFGDSTATNTMGEWDIADRSLSGDKRVLVFRAQYDGISEYGWEFTPRGAGGFADNVFTIYPENTTVNNKLVSKKEFFQYDKSYFYDDVFILPSEGSQFQCSGTPNMDCSNIIAQGDCELYDSHNGECFWGGDLPCSNWDSEEWNCEAWEPFCTRNYNQLLCSDYYFNEVDCNNAPPCYASYTYGQCSDFNDPLYEGDCNFYNAYCTPIYNPEYPYEYTGCSGDTYPIYDTCSGTFNGDYTNCSGVYGGVCDGTLTCGQTSEEACTFIEGCTSEYVPINVSSNLYVEFGNVSINGNLTVKDSAFINTTWTNDLNVSGNSTLNNLTVINTWTNKLNVSGNSTLKDVTVSGNFTLINTVWDDVVIPMETAHLGINAPDYKTFIGDLEGYAFEDVALPLEQEAEFIIQIPHKIKTGTTPEFHIHGSPGSNNGSLQNVTFYLSYSCANITGIFKTPTTLTKSFNLSVANAYSHNLLDFGSLTGCAAGISELIKLKLHRNSSLSSDTFNQDYFILSVDAHIEISRLGSDNKASG